MIYAKIKTLNHALYYIIGEEGHEYIVCKHVCMWSVYVFKIVGFLIHVDFGLHEKEENTTKCQQIFEKLLYIDMHRKIFQTH